MMRTLFSAKLMALAALATLSLTGSLTAQAAYSVAPNISAGIALAGMNPEAAPAGSNLSTCQPSSQHPYPVVLVPGTFSNMQNDFAGLAPKLANAGYCVYSLNYSTPFPYSYIKHIGAVPAGAQVVSNFVAQVLAQTGASKVDLVGHSQGGMVAEYYAKVLHGAGNIHNLIGLSPSTHGTTLDGFANLAPFFPGANALLVGGACQACVDQESSSTVIATLNNGPVAQAGVSYTIIETQNEYVVTPVGSAFINEAGVNNIYVQNVCPNDSVDHADLSYDNVTIQLVQNALSPSTATAPNCALAFPANLQ